MTKSDIFRTCDGTVIPVVLCDHLYSHVSRIDGLARIEQLVTAGGQTDSGTKDTRGLS